MNSEDQAPITKLQEQFANQFHQAISDYIFFANLYNSSRPKYKKKNNEIILYHVLRILGLLLPLLVGAYIVYVAQFYSTRDAALFIKTAIIPTMFMVPFTSFLPRIFRYIWPEIANLTLTEATLALQAWFYCKMLRYGSTEDVLNELETRYYSIPPLRNMRHIEDVNDAANTKYLYFVERLSVSNVNKHDVFVYYFKKLESLEVLLENFLKKININSEDINTLTENIISEIDLSDQCNTLIYSVSREHALVPTLFGYTEKTARSVQTAPSNLLDDMDYSDRLDIAEGQALHWRINKPCANVKITLDTEKLTFFAKAVEKAFGEKIPQFLK